MPDHGQQMTRCLYQLLTQVRDRVREDLAVILAGGARPLSELLRITPAAARKARTILGQTESRRRSGNARLAVRLLDQANTSSAMRDQ
jgi:hypothetical protein